MIIDGRTEGLWFDVPRRPSPARLFVVHYTAGEGGAPQVFRTLRARRLSVHFHIDNDGRIVQLAPLEARCAHASDVNDFSIGVEISNKGIAPPTRGHAREEYRDRARRRDGIRFLDFHAVQTAALLELADHVADVAGVPRMLPLEHVLPSGVTVAYSYTRAPLAPRVGDRVCRDPLLPRSLTGGVGTRADARARTALGGLFRGVVGHCHVPSKSGKVDPGPRILDALARHWGLIT